MWLLLQALLLVQVNLSTSTFCKSLTSESDPRLCGQGESPAQYYTGSSTDKSCHSACVCFIIAGDWVASNNDAYLLSATCDPNLVFVDIYKNPESTYEAIENLFEVYSIDYNCTGDDSLTVSGELPDTLYIHYIYMHIINYYCIKNSGELSGWFHLLFNAVSRWKSLQTGCCGWSQQKRYHYKHHSRGFVHYYWMRLCH